MGSLDKTKKELDTYYFADRLKPRYEMQNLKESLPKDGSCGVHPRINIKDTHSGRFLSRSIQRTFYGSLSFVLYVLNLIKHTPYNLLHYFHTFWYGVVRSVGYALNWKSYKYSVLDSSWTVELQQYTKIRLLLIDSCINLREEIGRLLPLCKFVDCGEEVTVVGCMKTSRIKCDAEAAIQKAVIRQDDGHKNILLMFHLVADSNTVEDVRLVWYREPSMYKTFHVPFKKN